MVLFCTHWSKCRTLSSGVEFNDVTTTCLLCPMLWIVWSSNKRKRIIYYLSLQSKKETRILLYSNLQCRLELFTWKRTHFPRSQVWQERRKHTLLKVSRPHCVHCHSSTKVPPLLGNYLPWRNFIPPLKESAPQQHHIGAFLPSWKG